MLDVGVELAPSGLSPALFVRRFLLFVCELFLFKSSSSDTVSEKVPPALAEGRCWESEQI